MSDSSAARTNLTSNNVTVTNYKLGEGSFRECYQGTYVGGNRNKQSAACKRFKSQYAGMPASNTNYLRKISKLPTRPLLWRKAGTTFVHLARKSWYPVGLFTTRVVDNTWWNL